jgi:hypothetical protein
MSLLSEKLLQWPDGPLDRQAPASAAAVELAVWNKKTVVDYSPAVATAMTAVPSAELNDGAELIINVDQDATGRSITLGAGFEGTGITGNANDKDSIICSYDKAAGVFRVLSVYKTQAI